MEWPTWNEFFAELIRIGIRVGLALGVLLLGRVLSHAARKVALRGLSRTDLTASMATIFVAVAYYGIWLLAIVGALLLLGVPSGVVLTSIGIVFVILAFSLQQSLRDLAAAVIFMLFKPFRLGDFIETKGTSGTVEDIGPFTTTIVQWDSKVVVLPNSQIQESGITNYTTKPSLVTDLDVRVRVGDDTARARALIEALLAEDPRVLAEPPLRIPVVEEDGSWATLQVRAAVRLDDYWDVQDGLRERVRVELEDAGLALPFPRLDVHLREAPQDPTHAA